MWLLKFLGLAAIINLYNAVDVIPKEIKTQTGDSYTILMKDDKITPVHCFLDDGENYYELDLKTAGVPAIPITSIAADVEVITSLGDGICGFKLDNVTRPNVRWHISFTYNARHRYSKFVQTTLRDLPPRSTKIFASVGDKIVVPCSVVYSKTQIVAHYCELHDPSGKLQRMGKSYCEYTKPATTIADFGMWTCIINTEDSMGSTIFEYEVIKQEQNIINIWKNETETHVNIGCSITNPLNVLNYCIMVRPDGEKFVLTPGKATQRYTNLKTDLANYICNMEILKPLDETEENLWRCEMHSGSGRKAFGGFIDLSTSKTLNKADQVYTPETVIVLKDKEFSIKCRVQYSSPYCYMIGANGLRYPVADDRSPTLGLCEFSKRSTLADNGTWYCGFAMSNGEPDKVYPLTVLVVSVLEQLTVKPENETVYSELSNSAQLMCTTNGFGGEPLKYCLFRSPKGDTYFINDKQTTNRISYSGRGLEFGDCGILISDVRMEDEGVWSCITRIGHDFKNKELSSDIRLRLNSYDDTGELMVDRTE